MKIVWNENPLLTQIFLDEHEKKEFWYKIKIEEMEENIILDAWFHLDQDGKNKEYFDLKRARSNLDPNYIYPDWNDNSKKDQKSELDKRVDQLFEYYIDDLEHNSHCGDCTCVPCSCSKCHAENLLGIDTRKGLGKHEAYKIQGAFRKDKEGMYYDRNNQRTISEAIEILKNHDTNPTKPKDWPDMVGFESHIPRWNKEAVNAIEWLENYRDEHFKVDLDMQLGDNSNAHK